MFFIILFIIKNFILFIYTCKLFMFKNIFTLALLIFTVVQCIRTCRKFSRVFINIIYNFYDASNTLCLKEIKEFAFK